MRIGNTGVGRENDSGHVKGLDLDFIQVQWKVIDESFTGSSERK